MYDLFTVLVVEVLRLCAQRWIHNEIQDAIRACGEPPTLGARQSIVNTSKRKVTSASWTAEDRHKSRLRKIGNAVSPSALNGVIPGSARIEIGQLR